MIGVLRDAVVDADGIRCHMSAGAEVDGVVNVEDIRLVAISGLDNRVSQGEGVGQVGYRIVVDGIGQSNDIAEVQFVSFVVAQKVIDFDEVEQVTDRSLDEEDFIETDELSLVGDRGEVDELDHREGIGLAVTDVQGSRIRDRQGVRRQVDDNGVNLEEVNQAVEFVIGLDAVRSVVGAVGYRDGVGEVEDVSFVIAEGINHREGVSQVRDNGKEFAIVDAVGFGVGRFGVLGNALGEQISIRQSQDERGTFGEVVVDPDEVVEIRVGGEDVGVDGREDFGEAGGVALSDAVVDTNELEPIAALIANDALGDGVGFEEDRAGI